CECVQKQEAVQTQIVSLHADVKKLQADAVAPPPQSLAQAAVHTENFITALVNLYKGQQSPAVQQVGVCAFYEVVSFVCADTLRHPPTRQYLSSCAEILGQVFIQGTAAECGRVLAAILENRHLCPLISPFFTPNAAPNELVFLYQDVLLSPECWRVSLRVLGCLPPPRSAKTTVEPAASSGVAATTVSLSPQQAAETVEWLSDYFLRSRLSKTDLRTFGLYSAWTPYISDVVTFWGHLAGCLVNVQVCACAREPVGSAKVLQ
ncbi:hypothetical protein CRUP_009205, partial [Coryphaenoides rupestris]